MEPRQNEYDVIVVGSGPGGASVARGLAGEGRKTLILEWGDNDPVKGTFLQTLPRAFLPGRGLLLTGQALGMVRGITTGGSSLLYCATAFDPPTAMLRRHGVDIAAEAEELKTEIPIAPLKDELMSPAAQVFLESASDLGYDVGKLNKFIYQDKCETDCQLCLYGCPQGAKWNARNFVADALQSGARIINRARVEKVIVENGAAIGVEYKRRGAAFKVFADKVVVSAGGIGSPVILKRSGISGVGRDFFFDPLQYVFGTVKGVESGHGLSMCAGVHFEDEGIVMTDFNLPHLMKVIFDAEVFRFDRAFAYRQVVPIMIKIRDGLGGRVTDRGWIWKKATAEDRRKLKTGTGHAARILKNAGASNIYKSWIVAAHPGGTVKIGEHVDSNLKTEIENLYVCDCSVIPEEWGLPPTFTLLSLGKRLVKHLLRQDSPGQRDRHGRPADQDRAKAGFSGAVEAA